MATEAARATANTGGVFLLMAAVTGHVSCAAPPAERLLAVRALASPAGAGSGEPNLAVAPDGRVLLSWIEPAGAGRHRLRYSGLDANGTWSPARTIAEGAGWFVNWADFPALAALPDGTLFAHWLAKSGPATYAYDVQVASSPDGRTWGPPVVPHRDGTRTEHGFVSMTAWGENEIGMVWLDGRNTATAAASDRGPGAPPMSLVHATVGRDGALGPEVVLDDRVCDCCQTDLARAADAVVVVYRDRSETEVRDMSIVRFDGARWSAPRTLAADGWQINGCPVNGPAVAAHGRTVAVAWFTAARDQPAVKLAFSGDSGATFGPPIPVDDGRPLGRVDVALMGESTALVSWLEQGEKGSATLRLRRIARDGSRGDAASVAVSTSARSSGFPRMAWSGGRLVLAWRDAGDPPRVLSAIVETTTRR